MLKSNKVINCFVYLIFIIPFLPILTPDTLPIAGNYYSKDICSIFLATIIFSTLIFSRHFHTYKINLSQILIFIFILLLIFQTYFIKSYISYTLEACAVLSIGLILSFVINNYETKNSLIQLISSAILINSYVQIIICSLQLLNTNIPIYLTLYSFDATQSTQISFNLIGGSGERIGGGVLQSNNLADLLTWGLIANIIKFTTLNKCRLLYFTITLILICFFISLTFSRVAIIFAIFLMAYGIIIWFKDKFSSKLLLISGLCLLICIFMASKGYFNFAYSHYYLQSKDTSSSASLKNNARISNSFQSIQNILHGKPPGLIPSDSQRITLWQRGWNEFKAAPVLGVGWNYYSAHLFDPDIRKNSGPLQQLILPLNSHNIFIQLLATTGIIGSLIFICYLTIGIYKIWKLPTSEQILIFGCTTVMLIHSLVEYPLFYLPFLNCFFILFAIADSNIIFKIQNSRFLRNSIIIISAFIFWQIIIGINNFLILAQLKVPDNYIHDNAFGNIIEKYKIGKNPLWSYYVDADFAQKIEFNEINSGNRQLFNLLQNLTQNIVRFTPFPSYSIRLAYLEELAGNKEKAAEIIYDTFNNYPDFADTLQSWIRALSVNNPVVQKELLTDIELWKASYKKSY